MADDQSGYYQQQAAGRLTNCPTTALTTSSPIRKPPEFSRQTNNALYARTPGRARTHLRSSFGRVLVDTLANQTAPADIWECHYAAQGGASEICEAI
jgi:hypothetical protein